ncbi:MAG TPA: FAD-binding oxidoreductase [Acidimicrobiales bacterium]|nr:FAD-binding oxidoreductase [Acidimicrobiales bacterium]
MDLIDELRAAVGDEHVLVDDDVRAGYERDWTGRFVGRADAVVRPASTDEVSRVVSACARHRVPIVPQGGNTGLVGGSVPGDGGVVVSLTRLGAVTDVDPVAGQLTAGAGVTLAAVHEAARAAGWAYGVDFAARDTATVGGMVATNAGGHHVVRHGATRRQLLGVEAVLADGQVVSRLGGLVKDNTGYDLAGLVCGSEGTLAIVTAARLALVAPARDRVTALVGFATGARAVAALGPLRLGVRGLEAAELMLADGLDLVAGHLGAPHPFARPSASNRRRIDADVRAVLLVEAAGGNADEELAAALDGLEVVGEPLVALDAPRRAELWRWRDAHTEAIATLGAPHKLDVTLPTAALAPALDEVPRLVSELRPGARTWIFGHAGDGNLHVNVTGLDPDDDAVDAAILRAVAGWGGSISAEHGIGRAKVAYLHLSRSPAEIDAFRRIKAALDPTGVLNPGVLLAPR